MGRHGGGGFGSGSSGGDGGADFGGHDYGSSFGSHHHGQGLFSFSHHGESRSHWFPSATSLLEGAAVGAAVSSIFGRTGRPRGPLHQPPAAIPSWGYSRPAVPVAPAPSTRQSRTCCGGSWWPLLSIAVVLFALYLSTVVYAPQDLELGAHDSRLLDASPTFCSYIKVVNTGDNLQQAQATMYSLRYPPQLSKKDKWLERHDRVTVRGYGFEDWAFWLNRGSKVKVEYELPYRGRLQALVIKGEDRLKQWQSDPDNFDNHEYRKYISGQGSFSFQSAADGDYFFAFGNFYSTPREISVAFQVESRVYDVSHAFASCSSPPKRDCVLHLSPSADLAAVITAQGSPEAEEVWHGRVEYGKRWSTYLFLVGGTWLLGLIASGCCCCCPCCPPWRRPQPAPTQPPVATPEHAPLLHPYHLPPRPFFSPAEASVNYPPAGPPPPPPPAAVPAGAPAEPSAPPLTPPKEADEGSLCCICFDAPKDAILDPCGHKATCHVCATRLLQSSAPICPICRTTIKRVLRIFDA